MRLELDLGFSSLVVLVACAVVPLIVLVLRSKWRRSAARKEEIRRLMILASEETVRAELEASGGHGCGYGYGNDYDYDYAYADGYGDGYGAVPASQINHCAVCHSPTTTRCAQCKAVRYCSGKCQIIHWRLGHKDECRPPATKSDIDDKILKHEQDVSCGSKLEDESRLQSKSAALFHGDSISADSTEASKVKRRSLKADFIADDAANDKSRTSSCANNVDQAKTISQKFASLVDTVGSCSGVSGFNQTNPVSSAGQVQCKLTSPPSSANGSMRDSSAAEPSRSSTSFWERALDPSLPTGLLRKTSVPSTADGSRTNNVSDSSLNYSVNSSGSNIVEKASLHDPAPKNKDNSESILESVDTCNESNSLSLKSERSSYMRIDSTLGSESFRSSEAKSSISLQSNISSGSRKDTSATTACRSNRHLDPIVRSRQADETNATAAAVSSEVAGRSPSAGSDLKTSVAKVADQLKGSIPLQQYSLRGGSDIAGKYSDKGFFPYELFVKLYTWKEVELRPCGLRNCGNSCYANAVLQCLAFTPPLTAYFLQGLHSKMCAKKGWCFMCEFESLILKAKEGESPVSPFGIVSRLEDIGSQLSNGREEDAHEFLRYTIDAMESICLMGSRIPPGSLEEDTTLVGLTFGGYLRSKIRCTNCQSKSERHERMMDLTVEIDGDIGTLEEALRRFTLAETLDGENKYHCSRCGSYEKARKKLTILEAPNVLTIVLKRFQTGKLGKLTKSIRYPEILDLAPYMSGTSDKSPIYRLYGVIVHLDVTNASYSGHYVCYVKNPQNKWFSIDDSRVTPADLETVLKVGAYMLLYSRCSPRAPRSIRNRIRSSDPKPKHVPTRVMPKIPTLNLKHSGGSCDDLHPNPMSSDGLASMETFYSRFQRLRRMLEEDSPSDSSSLFSNNSDEGSSSSDGTRESTCTTDDFSDFLFGGWSSSWRNSSDSDSSSSSMPSSSSSSPMASSSQRRAAGFPETSVPLVDSEANNSFLHSDTSKSRRNLLSSSSSGGRGNCRQTDSERLVDAANGFDGVKSGRRSVTAGERTERVP
ncbi:ubiquitin carboxyl-terminal hydrolase 18-like isoform X2 [Punica granatum]|uniref:ubiquitinyl hydrolase 1 n=1 Tax=Punica granatum TaxID=22663 RepID=A0A6P8DK44_PUNGR|nr:ubiquitin carboxyl-terminal hydrolase 18-like isoform X2 [Punica granatum]